MSALFFNFRKYFFNRKIKQDKPSGIARKGSNIKQAHTFGILFDASTPENIAVAEELQHLLVSQQKEVDLLGYKINKAKEEILPPHIFSKESISWNFIPDNTAINSFIHQSFDVLICLQQENLLPMEYIMAMSHAKFRVGKHFSNLESYYELMLDVSDQDSLHTLSDLIKNWLMRLKFE